MLGCLRHVNANEDNADYSGGGLNVEERDEFAQSNLLSVAGSGNQVAGQYRVDTMA